MGLSVSGTLIQFSAAFLTQTIALDESTNIKYEIWDTVSRAFPLASSANLLFERLDKNVCRLLPRNELLSLSKYYRIYKSLALIYLRNSNAAVIVHDITQVRLLTSGLFNADNHVQL